MRQILNSVYSLKLKNIILSLTQGLIVFPNDHIRNVVSTLPNVMKIDVENDIVFSTLFNVVQTNVEANSIGSTLFNIVNFNVDMRNVVSALI